MTEMAAAINFRRQLGRGGGGDTQHRGRDLSIGKTRSGMTLCKSTWRVGASFLLLPIIISNAIFQESFP